MIILVRDIDLYTRRYHALLIDGHKIIHPSI